MEKEKDYLFLTHMIPKEIEVSVRNKSKNNMPDAANALQWHIYEGLTENLSESPAVITFLPVGSFPQYYKDPFIKREQIKNRFLSAGFCNIKLLRKFLLPNAVYKELKKYYKNNNSKEKNLIVYTMNSAFLQAISKLKNKYTDIKVCAIVADLPDMSSLTSKKSFLQRYLNKYLSGKSYSYSDCVDSYVLLTRQMADYIGINKPFSVMEGISTITENVVFSENEDDIKKILYTGTLHKKFGVLNLVEAFSKIKSEKYRLIICGVGDSESIIKKYAESDKRIEFMGQVTRTTALKLQQQATVLVNPRQNIEEFTKYSFPSKNLEYLSSGKPLIAYKLDGIPDEYDDYIYYAKDNSIETLSDLIVQVCDLPIDYRISQGKKARDFVIKEKNSFIQTKKIIKLLDNL